MAGLLIPYPNIGILNQNWWKKLIMVSWKKFEKSE
jgi:hypothetical protein